jgi:hypothetical protein
MWGSLSRSGSHGNGLHLAAGPTSCDFFCSARVSCWPTREDSYLEACVSAAGGAADASEAGGDVIDTSARDPELTLQIADYRTASGSIALDIAPYTPQDSHIGSR